MDLGTSIFLSSLTICLTILYLKTNQSWNWKKIIKRIGIGIGILIVLISIILAVALIVDNKKSIIVPLTEFSDIKITDSKSDIKFIRGNPTSKKEDQWEYGESYSISHLVIYFEDNKITLIISKGYESMYGIFRGDSYKKVIEKFGEPSNQRTSGDETTRWYFFDKYNIVIGFEKNKVISRGIYDKEYW